MGRLIDADVLREEVYSWGMNDYEPSDFTDAIDDAPTVEAIPKADYEFQKRNEYRRGYHDAIRKALKESFNIHCDEGNFKVVQEETLIGLGLSENEALGDIISRENYENRLKADLVAMLRFLWNDIENLDAPICDYASSDCISKWQVHEIIQQKINALN